MPKIRQAEFVERPFTEGDLDALVLIEQQAGSACWSRPELAHFTSQLDSDTRVITAEDALEEPIAFYVVQHGDKTLYLCNVAVGVPWRREGVASYALKCVEELATQLSYQQIVLDVQEENLAAQLLYRKAGFRAISVHAGFYRLQDGYHMVKSIPG